MAVTRYMVMERPTRVGLRKREVRALGRTRNRIKRGRRRRVVKEGGTVIMVKHDEDGLEGRVLMMGWSVF